MLSTRDYNLYKLAYLSFNYCKRFFSDFESLDCTLRFKKF